MLAVIHNQVPRILYEDRHIICVEKPVGMLSQGSKDTNLPDLVEVLLQRASDKGEKDAYIGVVHRLDCGVGGVMVYAKKQYAAGLLSEAVRERDFVKEYLCIVCGRPQEPFGEFCDLLYKDAKKNKTFIVDRTRNGVREARLSYTTLAECEYDGEILSLLRVTLGTGRSHQIRAQLSHHGIPILLDRKYGGRTPRGLWNEGIALWSYHLAFQHPVNMEQKKRTDFVRTERQQKRRSAAFIFDDMDIICLPDTNKEPWCLFEAAICDLCSAQGADDSRDM